MGRIAWFFQLGPAVAPFPPATGGPDSCMALKSELKRWGCAWALPTAARTNRTGRAIFIALSGFYSRINSNEGRAVASPAQNYAGCDCGLRRAVDGTGKASAIATAARPMPNDAM